MPNVKTIELTGTETAVRFNENYPYFWVKNLGGGDVFMSLYPNIIPGADGVIFIPANSGRSTGDVGQADILYFSGSEKIEITPQHNAVCPFFKYSGEGGESGGTHSAITADKYAGIAQGEAIITEMEENQ